MGGAVGRRHRQGHPPHEHNRLRHCDQLRGLRMHQRDSGPEEDGVGTPQSARSPTARPSPRATTPPSRAARPLPPATAPLSRDAAQPPKPASPTPRAAAPPPPASTPGAPATLAPPMALEGAGGWGGEGTSFRTGSNRSAAVGSRNTASGRSTVKTSAVVSAACASRN